jgi:hypothetical protein
MYCKYVRIRQFLLELRTPLYIRPLLHYWCFYTDSHEHDDGCPYHRNKGVNSRWVGPQVCSLQGRQQGFGVRGGAFGFGSTFYALEIYKKNKEKLKGQIKRSNLFPPPLILKSPWLVIVKSLLLLQ